VVPGDLQSAPPPKAAATPRSGLLSFLSPSRRHTVGSAAILLSIFTLISRCFGLVRDKYIAYAFGAGWQTDAFNVAFNLPDLIQYFLVGGAASISFVTILSRYREQGREEDGEVALSVILNTMFLVLGTAIVLAELLAPLYIRIYSKGDPRQDALAVLMTRILLPGQLAFFAGGVLASVALVRKQFSFQAVSPLLYTVGTITGGVLLSHWLGIPSLAWGALAGSIVGPFGVNAYAAWRMGARWRPILDLHNEGLRTWVRMSVPLMLGVTVVYMDNQILQYFAKHGSGDISRLMNAKKLFTAPMAIIGQAAGAASLPFFASLYSGNMFADYAAAVNRSVTRILAVALLLTSAMTSLAAPLSDLIFRGGQYTAQDSAKTAVYLAIFALSLAFWSSQAIYIRAFYAAGQTLPPMVAGTIVTVVSLPLYAVLYRSFGVVGLAWASNLAIVLHTVTVAILLHRRYLVPLFGLDFGEILRAFGAAVVSGLGVVALLHAMPVGRGFLWDIVLLLLGGGVWAGIGFAVLHASGSKLPQILLRRGRA
jgi:putative peptidoglycan lipid II flippase